MPNPPIDLSGQRFGLLTAIRPSGQRSSNGAMKWLARCDCGSENVYEFSNLKRGQSCGCNRFDMRPLTHRIEEGSIPEPNSGCWIWLGALTAEIGRLRGAYGTITVFGIQKKAHRVSFEAFHHAIPDGMEVCHRCDNPICVNPDHLFVGTHLDNMIDRDRKCRRTAPRGTKNGWAKLDDETIRAIRDAQGTQAEIAERYGTDQTNVSLIRRRKRWAHII